MSPFSQREKDVTEIVNVCLVWRHRGSSVSVCLSVCVCASGLLSEPERAGRRESLAAKKKKRKIDGGISGSDINLTERSLTCEVTSGS